MEYEVRLLGRFSVRRDGTEIPPASYEGRLVRTLLRVLAIRRGTFVSRDFLVEALWADRVPADPERNLNVMVARARRALGDPALILTGPGGYSFDPDDRCLIDSDEFMRLVRAGRASAAAGLSKEALQEYSSALKLWNGDPLAEDAYQQWALEYRSTLLRLRQEALESGAEAAIAAGDPMEAVILSEQAVAQEPLREAAHLVMAKALSAAGDNAAALTVIAGFKSRLVEELGLDPSPALDEVDLAILRGEPAAPGTPAARHYPHGMPTARHRLPGQAFDKLAFVGRDPELDEILSILGSGSGIVLLKGESGSGKSRLIEQIRLLHDGPVAEVAAFLGERDEPWSLARTLIREVLSLFPDAVGSLSERAALALSELVPELLELVPISPESTDPESRRALAMEAAINLVRSLTGQLIPIVVDDLQWSDPTSLSLLTQLAYRVPDLAMVLALRPEEVNPRSAVARYIASMAELTAAEIDLGPLSEDAIESLVVDPDLAGVIARHTDRTPLAISELVRTLAAEGAIGIGSGGWVSLSGGLAEKARKKARAGQRKAFVRRAGKLDSSTRRVIRLMALLGRPAPARLLARASGAVELDTLEHLEALTRAGLVHLTEAGWDTAHDLIGESLSAAMEPEEKARLHAQIASALAAENADPWEQAHHLAASGDSAAAAELFVRAGKQSLDSFATEEAERSAEAGLALMPEPVIRSELLEIRAEARIRRGQLREARHDLRSAMPAKKTGPERSRILAKLALLISGSEDYLQASELAALAVTEAGSDAATRARALAVASMVQGNLNHLDEAERMGMEALLLFHEAEDAHGVADILELKALHTLNSGHVSEGVEALGKVVSLFQDSGKLLRIGQPRALRSLALVMEGRAEEALSELDETLEIELALGHAEGLALVHSSRAVALVAMGNLRESVEEAELSVAAARLLEHKELTAMSLFALGLARESTDDLEAAERMFSGCFEASSNIPLFQSLAAARLSRLSTLRGDFEGAELYVSTSLEVGSPFALFESRLAHAELAAARHDPEANRIAAEALQVALAEGHQLSVPRLRELAGVTN